MIELAAVVIGRNEGARLIECLDSLVSVTTVIYVDSGSTDGSVEAARMRGAEVVALDMERPFTAARARNAGLDRLRDMGGAQFVQFVDGDCEVVEGWLDVAAAYLRANPEVAVVCGRRRERAPEASIYNAQCDREWDTPVGEALACGGDALMRMAALDEVGGYDPHLIAGEEPELCLRLRAKGWRVVRIDAEMTRHDADITRFSQFWKRARRAGYAYAEGAHMHGKTPERHFVSQTLRALVWGYALPVMILIIAMFGTIWALGLVLIYPAQILRLALKRGGTKAAFAEAWLLTISKFAEARGALEFHVRKAFKRPSGLIEYK
ncbi:glycosyltransferase [Celeribacter sp.]|uniref:glycosyltransferase n=1 Tax=Celeribacter sp. TaxID=1890673 RepID=UPI003A903088